MIGKRIRHINRYRDIATALIRHGFGFIVEGLDVFQMLSLPARLLRETEKVSKKSVGERIRYVLQELGPTFVKLGQIASTRPDIIPEKISTELEKLQDQVDSFPFDEVKAIIERELNRELNEMFSSFDEVPLAAASIGQVHLGMLVTGEPVAVKIQRPAIPETIKTDLEILGTLAVLAENRFDWAKRYQIQQMIQEFGKSLIDELDYTIEGQNTDRVAKQFLKDANIHIPGIYWEYSSNKVLVIEFIEGIKVNNLEQINAKGYDHKKIAEHLIQAFLHQVFIEGFFHADPHPGNLLVMPDERIAFIDFGMVGRLTSEMKNNFANLIIALMRQSTDGVIKSIMGMGLVNEDVNMSELRRDVNLLREKYYGVSFSEVSLGGAVKDLFDTANRHQIVIPPDLVLLGKALLTIEGVVEKLDPEISIVQLAEPFGKRLLKERLNPKRIAEDVWKEISEYSGILLNFPKQFREVMNVVKQGHMRLEVSVPQLDLFLRKLDRISNRLAFSIVLLAFSIIMAGLIIGSSLSGYKSVLWNVPAIELGFFIAVSMSIWLIYSIFKSGRF
jgi:ubiquinone biosynthesis protein